MMTVIKKKKGNNQRQSQITPRAGVCPLAVSLKSDRKIGDEKGNRQLCYVASLDHPVLCFSADQVLLRWLQAVTGISNRLVSMPLLTAVLRHCQ